MDAAIETLSQFVTPGRLDEEVLSELADCHFQSGDYQTTAGTYMLLSSFAPDNLLYKVRRMQTAYRMKAFDQSALAGKEILQRDSIPALSTIGCCYEMKKDYRQAKDWFERYLKVAKPGSKGYTFVEEELKYVNSELFMEE